MTRSGRPESNWYTERSAGRMKVRVGFHSLMSISRARCVYRSTRTGDGKSSRPCLQNHNYSSRASSEVHSLQPWRYRLPRPLLAPTSSAPSSHTILAVLQPDGADERAPTRRCAVRQIAQRGAQGQGERGERAPCDFASGAGCTGCVEGDGGGWG